MSDRHDSPNYQRPSPDELALVEEGLRLQWSETANMIKGKDDAEIDDLVDSLIGEDPCDFLENLTEPDAEMICLLASMALVQIMHSIMTEY